VTLVVAGAEPEASASETVAEIWKAELEHLLTGESMTTRDAVALISTRFHLPRKTVYEAALKSCK
jgi:hypothetical protein